MREAKYHEYRPDAANWRDVPAADDLPAEVIASGDIWQRGLLWSNHAVPGLTAGLWESGVFETRPFTFGGDEFFFVAEGEVRLLQHGRPEVVIGPGEAVLVPRGSEIVWQQTSKVRKLFMRFDAPDAPVLSASPTVTKIVDDLGKAEPGSYPPALLSTAAPEVLEWKAVADPAGLSAGIWAATAYARRATSFGRYELMIFLAGEINLQFADGERRYRAGDAIFIDKGIDFAWASTDMRKFTCGFG